MVILKSERSNTNENTGNYRKNRKGTTKGSSETRGTDPTVRSPLRIHYRQSHCPTSRQVQISAQANQQC